MKKLAISILTYNRSKHIREDLAAIAQPTKEQNIDIYIFDGSTDERTKHVIDQYIQKGYDHIYYFHTDKQLSPLESMIERITNAFHMPDAEYIWFCGDKFTIRPEHYSEIFSYIEKSYDIITIYGLILKGTKEFYSVSKYVDYAMVPLTLWGANIIRKKLIEPYHFGEEIEKTPSFGVTSVYLQAIANCKTFKGAVIDTEEQVHIKSRYKTPSSSRSCMWLVWVQNWYWFINSLPSIYDNIKGNLYNRLDLQMHFFCLWELLRQRSEGQFGWKKCWEYRQYVKKVIVMPYIFVLWVSLLPEKVAGWLCKNYYDLLSKFLRLKNRVNLTVKKLWQRMQSLCKNR